MSAKEPIIIRIPDNMWQQMREQIGIFELTIGNLRIPVILNEELPDGTIASCNRSPFELQIIVWFQ